MNLNLETVFKDREGLRRQIQEEKKLYDICTSLALLILLCSTLYGFTMGFHHSGKQALSASLKVPLLFFATLLVSMPTLHFIGLLFGSRISFRQTLTVLLWGLGQTGVLLLAFAPISLFFLLSGSSYPFLLLMHVGVFAFAGGAGLFTIADNIRYLRSELKAEIQNQDENKESREKNSNTTRLLWLWMFLYMFVGTQMAYLLSPFIGKTKEFMFFYQGKGNFYSHILESLFDLMR